MEEKKTKSVSDKKKTTQDGNINNQSNQRRNEEEKTLEDGKNLDWDEQSKEKKQSTVETKKDQAKSEVKKRVTDKKIGKKEDFKYIVRIANTDINGEKTVVYGLTTIKGIGLHLATAIVDIAGIDRNRKIGDLDEENIEKLKETINTISKNTPSWMLNHRKDYETGLDKHLVGSDIDMKLRDEINIMKKIRCYRGIRHERGLPVRGQRTQSNNRKGLALGVSRKRR